MRSFFTLFLLTLTTFCSSSSAAPAKIAARQNPTGPLIAFHTQFFFGLFISTDEALFNETFDTGYSPNLVENGNGVDFTFTTFKAFVETQRAVITNRKLVSSEFHVVADDSTGLTGEVGHIAVVSAVLNGEAIVATIVAVLRTELDSNGNQINTAERFVLEINPA